MTRTAAPRAAAVRATALVLALALVLSACGDEVEGPAGGGSTLERTLGDPDGDGALDVRPGEPLRDRTEVAPAGRPGAVLFTWAQLSDLHVRDEESPSRVPFLDRYGAPFGPTFRPQEALSAQVLAAAVRAVNAQRPQSVFVTGDVADNAQLNELRLAQRILDGGEVDPDTGGRGYRGVQQDSNPDPFYYRPDVDPPRHPRLLAHAQEAFASPGLEAPWHGLPGNHDTLLQGELRPDPPTDGIATGTRLVTSLDPAARLPEAATTAEAVEALLGAAAGGRSLTVPADRERRSATPAELTDLLANGQATRVPDRLDYVVDATRGLRFVVLDVTSRTGGQEATVDPAQVTWLEQQVRTPRRIVLVTHQPPAEELLAVLDDAGNAVAALHGDSHRNRIAARGRYWIIGTSSLADWPMQARMFRLRRTDGDGLALETWMVDHDGRGLAGTARALSYLDAQGGRPRGLAGARGDRNARLFVP